MKIHIPLILKFFPLVLFLSALLSILGYRLELIDESDAHCTSGVLISGDSNPRTGSYHVKLESDNKIISGNVRHVPNHRIALGERYLGKRYDYCYVDKLSIVLFFPSSIREIYFRANPGIFFKRELVAVANETAFKGLFFNFVSLIFLYFISFCFIRISIYE